MNESRTPSEAALPVHEDGDDAGPVRVLHVEDNPSDIALIQAFIRDLHPDVVFDTVTRLEDLTADRAAAADCAVLDLSLPDASGLEALVALRAMSTALPIIVLTGHDELPLGVDALRSGADDYLVKDQVDGRSLQRDIQHAVERRKLTLALIRQAARAEEPVPNSAESTREKVA